MTNDIIQHLVFNTLIDAYLFIVMIRLLAEQQGIGLANPLMRFVHAATRWVSMPLDKVFPRWHHFSFGLLFFMLLLQGLQNYVLFVMALGIQSPQLGGVFIVGAATLANKFINVYFTLIIFGVAISWLPVLQNNPFAEIVVAVTAPVLRPIQRVLPRPGGLDFSPIIALIILQLIATFVLFPVINFGTGLVIP